MSTESEEGFSEDREKILSNFQESGMKVLGRGIRQFPIKRRDRQNGTQDEDLNQAGLGEAVNFTTGIAGSLYFRYKGDS